MAQCFMHQEQGWNTTLPLTEAYMYMYFIEKPGSNDIECYNWLLRLLNKLFLEKTLKVFTTVVACRHFYAKGAHFGGQLYDI